MRCWNCRRQIPENAKICAHCEAPVEPEPSAEEIEAVQSILEGMTPEVMAELHKAMEESSTAEDFVNRIFVGDCPNCESSATGDCENDPEIQELLVGRCYDCGQLWCTECGTYLKLGATECSCWDEDDDEDEDEDGDDDLGD